MIRFDMQLLFENTLGIYEKNDEKNMDNDCAREKKQKKESVLIKYPIAAPYEKGIFYRDILDPSSISTQNIDGDLPSFNTDFWVMNLTTYRRLNMREHLLKWLKMENNKKKSSFKVTSKKAPV